MALIFYGKASPPIEDKLFNVVFMFILGVEGINNPIVVYTYIGFTNGNSL